MRILPRPHFLALPAGTLFMRYTPCVFTGLQIKGETVGEDFYCADLVGAVAWGTSGDYFERCMAMEAGGVYPANFEAWGRDLQFENDAQLYGVYDHTDVLALIETLKRVKATEKPRPVLAKNLPRGRAPQHAATPWLTNGIPPGASWDGMYTFHLTAPHLSSPIRGQLAINGDKAFDHRLGLPGVAEESEPEVLVLRWSNNTMWSLHRALDTGKYTLIADYGPARIERAHA